MSVIKAEFARATIDLVGDIWRDRYNVVVVERDEARAEVERLKEVILEIKDTIEQGTPSICEGMREAAKIALSYLPSDCDESVYATKSNISVLIRKAAQQS